jgi:anaerobic selenocysteine-containing dehydrogenase/ferredoxin-NADP reductase
MRRTRPKTEIDPGWVRIEWDEALAEIASRMADLRRQSGAEAIAFAMASPSGSALADSSEWIERLARVFGTPNIAGSNELCNWHKDSAHRFTFGCPMPAADYENADVIVLWGHNPTNTWLAQATAIGRGRKAGARLIVVDPRPIPLAMQADAWLPVRPGTDPALALGLIRQLVHTDSYDDDFVREWTNGPFLVRADTGRFLKERDLNPTASTNHNMVWDVGGAQVARYDSSAPAAQQNSSRFLLRGEVIVPVDGRRIACVPAFELLARTSAPYTPSEVERITGVKERSLLAAAALLRRGQRIAYHAWTGIAQHTNATQCERAIATLYALTGSFDKRGANWNHARLATNAVNSYALLAPEQRAKALGLDERPIGPAAQGRISAQDLHRAIASGEPYRIRALIAFGTNFLLTQAEVGLTQRALETLEFHVACDLFETPAARFADIVLPVSTPWEQEGLRVGFEISERAAAHVQLRQQIIPPVGEARSDNDIVFGLARQLGVARQFFGGTLEAGWNHILEPMGLTVEQLRRQPEGITYPAKAVEQRYMQHGGEGVAGFATETRRVELYSELLLRNGQPPLATFVEPAEKSRDATTTQGGRFRYWLTSAKSGYYVHSQHRSIPSLRLRSPHPVAELSVTLAGEKGVRDGDWIRISTRNGAARFVAKTVPSLAHDVIVAEFGWWQGCPEVGRDGYPVAGVLTSNLNQLISAEERDPVSASVAHRSFLCDVELDPSVDPQRRPWSAFRQFRVRELRREAEGVLAINLEALDRGTLPDYRPGQHISIRLNANASGAQRVRTYSLTGPAEVNGRGSYSIAVRLIRTQTQSGEFSEGAMSGYLHRRLTVGDVVHITAPAGNFLLPTFSPQPVVLFAGGIGITPFLSYLETLAVKPAMPDVWLFYANRNSATHAFRERLSALAKMLPGLRLRNHYDSPLPCDTEGKNFDSRELVSAGMVDQQLIEARARFYLCGPRPMMDVLRAGLIARGVPAFDIFSELFRSPTSLPPSTPGHFSVTFARTGIRNVTWTPARGSLLDFGESLGVPMASGCRVGQCESCSVRLIEGKVRHLAGDAPLGNEETCLACQAVPQTDLVVDA